MPLQKHNRTGFHATLKKSRNGAYVVHFHASWIGGYKAMQAVKIATLENAKIDKVVKSGDLPIRCFIC